jgi:hypothetical protein
MYVGPLSSFIFPAASGGRPYIVEDGEQLSFTGIDGGPGPTVVVPKERRLPVAKPLLWPDKKLTKKELIPTIQRVWPQLMGKSSPPTLEDGEQLFLVIQEDIYENFRNQLLGEFVHTGVVTRKQAKDMLLGAMYGRNNQP